MVPSAYFLTKGVGQHNIPLQSLELALQVAGIGHSNIVEVSSIIPPGCMRLSAQEGKERLLPGEITFAVMARNSSCEPHRRISASIGLAMPAEKWRYGYISEYHSFGETDEDAGTRAEDLAATMLSTKMGIALDPDKAWNERKRFFRASGLIVRTANITQSAACEKSGLWTTVVAAAVFIP